MLDTYLARTRQLLQNPAAPTPLYTTADLTSWINQARGQVAGDGQCIRAFGSITTVASTQAYSFGAITLPTSSVSGIQGALNINIMLYTLGAGQKFIEPRPWPWFSLYHLNDVVNTPGPPEVWSQYGQGAGASTGGGSFYLSPLPDDVYTLNADCSCYPIPLVDNATAEAIPYLWTDAVPYFAAYLALLSAQTNARFADAERYFGLYQEFSNRARRMTNSEVSPYIYNQSPDPVRQNRLGVQPAARGGG